MLETNVAQTLTLAVAAANSATTTDAASAAPAAAGVDGAARQPFAAVLQRHMAAVPEDAEAAKSLEALMGILDRQAAGDSTEVAADEQAALLAWLAPLFAGAVPAATVPAEKRVTGDDPSAMPGDPAGAIPGIIPIAIGAPNLSLALPGKDAAAGETAVAPLPTTATASIDATAMLAGTSLAADDAAASAATSAAEGLPSTSAILADARPREAENTAMAGNGRNGPAPAAFEALLAAAPDAMVASSQAAAHAAPQAVAHAAPTSAVVTPVTTPVGAQGWDRDIGDKLTWMVGRQETRAELVLNPPQMGRIEVTLSLQGDQATALFVSANPAVREALENAVPHLREVLQGAGIELGQAQVGAESSQHSAQGRENGDNPLRGGEGTADAMTITSSAAGSALRRGNGLVDTFA